MKIFLQRKFPALWYAVPCTEKCPTPEYSVGDIVELAHKQACLDKNTNSEGQITGV